MPPAFVGIAKTVTEPTTYHASSSTVLAFSYKRAQPTYPRITGYGLSSSWCLSLRRVFSFFFHMRIFLRLRLALRGLLCC
jgi:hypothetical protein